MRLEQAIVLVGGRGTRLQSVVSDVPKPLADVAGRPFLGLLLDRLVANGIGRIVLASGYMADKVEAAIGARWNGVEVVHRVESIPLGTGGAIHNALSGCEPGIGVHVLNGDTWLEYSPKALAEATATQQAAIGIALAHVEDVGRYGAVRLQGQRVIGFEEKGGHGPGHINAGCYYLSPAALARLQQPAPFSFETEVLVPACEAGQVIGYAETSGFIDIGVPEDYFRAQTLFASRG